MILATEDAVKGLACSHNQEGTFLRSSSGWRNKAVRSSRPSGGARMLSFGREVSPFGIELNTCPSAMPFISGHLKFTGKRDQKASGNQPGSAGTSLLQIRICWE